MDQYEDYEDELYHHGIKGQHWGNRRWQNADGSLTPEGYPHYGYNGPRKGLGPKKYRTSKDSYKLDKMGVKAYGTRADAAWSNNTRERTKQGARIGTVYGAAQGAVGTALAASIALAAGPISVPALVSYGATAMASGAISGALTGAQYGAIVGAIETHVGRKSMRAAGQKFYNVKYSDLKEKQ